MSYVRSSLIEVLVDAGLMEDQGYQDDQSILSSVREAWPTLSALLVFGLSWSLGQPAGAKRLWVCLSAGAGIAMDSSNSHSEAAKAGPQYRKALIDRKSVLLNGLRPRPGRDTKDVASIFIFGSATLSSWGPPICQTLMLVSSRVAMLFCASAE